MVYRKQLPGIPVNGNLVFINPHVSLRDVPKTEISCLRPNDIRQYLRNIKPQPRTKQYVKILNDSLRMIVNHLIYHRF